MNHMAKYWPLADIHLDRNSPSLVYSSKPLYRFAVEAVIRSFSNNPRCPSYREAVEELPLGMRLDLLAEMCDYPSLVEVQLQILSDPLLVSEFIKHLSGYLTPLVQCLQWLLSVKKSVLIQLYDRYEKITEENNRTRDYCRQYFECGLRIGIFLIETGWTQEARKILVLVYRYAVYGSEEEIAVLPHLVRASTLAGRMVNAFTSLTRMKRLANNFEDRFKIALLLPDSANQLQRLHDLQVSIFHSSSLFYFEGIRRTRHLSYKCAMQSLSKITKRSPSRLVIDVLRHFVRVCLYHRMYEKAVFTLKLAFCLVVHDYGRTSALYAGTLEDLAILLLACDQVTKSMEVYAEAQHIYMQLYGSRNLQLSLAQGNVTYGLCLQAYNTGRRDRALHHIALGLGNYKRNLPWEHRMVTQVELFNHKDIDPLSVKDIGYQLELIQHWENRSELELSKMMSDMYVLNYAELM